MTDERSEAADVEPDDVAAESADASAGGERSDRRQGEMPSADEAVAEFDAGEEDLDEIPDPLVAAEQKIGELTLDLQRLQAEYVNYKRRVDRDREQIKQNSVYAALAPVTEVIDTIDRAREHGPLEDGFKAVADQLENVVAAQGLTKFGEVGEVFDPTLHEALSHMGTDADVEETTIKVVAKSGYKIGDRVVRAAQVLVVDPE